MRAYTGRDIENTKKAAMAMVKTASAEMNIPETAFTVIFEGVDREDWESKVTKPVIEPLKDKIIIDHGKFV